MAQRTWFKVYAHSWLKGSLRQETPEFRGIWIDLLSLAANGDYGEEGVIKLAENVGFTDTQIAKIINITLKKWVATAKKLVLTDRIAIDDDNIITVLNWQFYQSEYGRQRSYRHRTENPADCNPKLQPEVTTEGYLQKEKEKEREREKEKEKENISPPAAAEPALLNSKNFGEFCRIYEENIGVLTPFIAQELETLCTEFQVSWYKEAVKEACSINKRALKYVAAILDRWGREGYKAPIKRRTGMPPGRPPRFQLSTTEELKRSWLGKSTPDETASEV